MYLGIRFANSYWYSLLSHEHKCCILRFNINSCVIVLYQGCSFLFHKLFMLGNVRILSFPL